MWCFDIIFDKKIRHIEYFWPVNSKIVEIMSKYKKFKILNFTFWDILKKHRIFNFYLNTKREESHYLGSELYSLALDIAPLTGK